MAYTLRSGVDVSAYDSKDLVIQCVNWRNPLTQEDVSGFTLEFKDVSAKQMSSGTYSISAGSYNPFPIQTSTITF